MDYAKFVNRHNELKFLTKVLSSSEFQFIPIWGRRRIGKTTLLLKAINKKGIYFLATESTDSENIKQFQEDSARCLKDPIILDLALNWETIFKYLGSKNAIIIIDEFPYLILSNPALPSIFQRIIDLYLKNTSTKLFLCGSSIRMMENQVLEYKAPLYGRRTGQIQLKPLRFADVLEFVPEYSFEDVVRLYGACGGVPMYIEQFKPDIPFWESIKEKMLNPQSILYSEVDILLKQELTQLGTYKSILSQIASGKTHMNEIRQALGAGKSDISPYLNNLSSIGLVKRMVPVTEDPSRSRRGIYQIDDNYTNFYFRYILPIKSMIESGYVKSVLESIKKDYDLYLGRIFEDIVIEAFIKWSISQGISWDNVGSWWYKGSEIDLLALSKSRDEMLCGEIKWTKKPVNKKVIENLMEKSEHIRWGSPKRKERYMIISRGGFSKECKHMMADKKILYWGLNDLIKIFSGDGK
jgi:AAA+ ATPase superfamily predicted ATPase